MPCRKCQKDIPDGAAFCPWCGAKQAVPARASKRRGNGQGSVYKTAAGSWQAEFCLYVRGDRLRHTKSGFTTKKEALAYVEAQGRLLRDVLSKAPLPRESFSPLVKLLDAVLLPTPKRPLSQQAIAQLPVLQAVLADPAHKAFLSAEALAQLEALQAPDDGGRSFTLAQAHDLWQQTRKYQQLSDDKRSHYRTAWSRLEKLWQRDISALRFCELQEAVSATPGAFYPKRDIKNLLSHLYKIAIREEAVTPEQDRVKYIELPDTPASKRDVFTPAEVAALWADYRDGHAIAGYALDMIYTGMRPGELRQIKKENVHLDESYMIGGIKTEAGRNRVIPLPNLILPVIREQLQTAANGLIDMREEDFYDEWAAMVRRTGVRPLPPYCCRHTAATALDAAGVDKTVIMSILGHKSYDTTLIYTHVSAERKVEAINKIAGTKTEDAP